jgi:3-dehydroquinate synthase
MVIQVDLGERAYPIVIQAGGLEGLGAAVMDVLPDAERCVVVTADKIGDLYEANTVESLVGAGLRVACLRIPEGEANKSVATWSSLVSALLALKIDRATPVLALGGGVVGDVVGFAAATVLRGVPLIQVPTTLLAMVDSAVGGKTGVNTAQGKNLVGAFYQPVLVFAAMETLNTLDEREIKSGLGEVLKHGVIGDAVLFDICTERATAILERDGETMVELVHRSCRLKADIVGRDERESGLRTVLNLGHTVGHAIETALAGGREAMSHGECVAVGLLAEARWAAARGACTAEVPKQIHRSLTGLGMAVLPPPLPSEAVTAALEFDKKFRHGKLRTAIIEAVGRVRLADIDAIEAMKMFDSISGLHHA